MNIKQPINFFWGATAAVLVLWTANLCIAISGASNGFLDTSGPFGDTFGAVNSLFTGLAFVGLIASLLLQRRELSLQRNELAATRKELASTVDEARKQNKNLEKQAFETTFLSLLKNHDAAVENVRHSEFNGMTRVVTNGQDAFEKILNPVYQVLKNAKTYPSSSTPANTAESAATAFSLAFIRHSGELERYLRTVAVTLQFLLEFNADRDSVYAKLMRAKMSNDEKLICYLYGATQDKPELSSVVERIELTRGIPLTIFDFPISYLEEAIGKLDKTLFTRVF